MELEMNYLKLEKCTKEIAHNWDITKTDNLAWLTIGNTSKLMKLLFCSHMIVLGCDHITWELGSYEHVKMKKYEKLKVGELIFKHIRCQ